MSKSNIAFTNEILRKVSTDLNIDIRKVEEVYKTVYSYIHYLSLFTDTVAIFIPNFGTMYMKASYINSKLKTLKEGSKRYNIYRSKLDKIRLHINSYVSTSIFHKKSRHIERMKTRNFYYTDGKTLEEIEKFQNEL